ncbi:hypothetical protein GGI04_003879 [Coemansia thaxteri]|nr:hypothetical protein GGI04_003879 [Coemansia thaxteri]
MNRALISALLALMTFACISKTCDAGHPYTSSEPAYATSTADAPAHVAGHSATVALPPPLTVAYQDRCNPCCANCVTYSDLHIDNEGDECCKPAAVIKTHNFVKEINYKCCTGPCGDVCCEPCCTKIICNPSAPGY